MHKSHLFKNWQNGFLGLIFALALFLTAAPAQADWVQVSSGTTATLRGVHFENLTTGWAVGDGGLILKTTDGGLNWSRLTSGTTENLYAVYFRDTSYGWAVGDNGVMRRTINGGSSWSGLTLGSSRLYGVYFSDLSNGLAVGVGGRVWQTSNGGVGWVDRDAGTGVILYDAGLLNIDDSTRYGWAVGGNDTVIKSTNSGTSWSVENTPSTSYSYYGLRMVSNLRGVAVGGGGKIIRTSDGGENWSSAVSPTSSSLWDIDSYTDVGMVAVGAAGTIVRTEDGGVSWSSEFAGVSSSTLYGVNMVSADDGWAVGTGGVILRYDGARPSQPGAITRTSADYDTTPTFLWGPSTDNFAIQNYEYSVDDGPWVNVSTALAATLSVPLSVGPHDIAVRAQDVAGNVSLPVRTLLFTITSSPGDGVAPETSITAGPGSGTSTAATFTFVANESATFECSLDTTASGSWSACTSPKSYSGLAVGPHSFYVRATDTAGNRDATPAVHSWTITAAPPAEDVTPPTVGAISPTSATVNVARTFSASYSDNAAVTYCELQVNGVVAGEMTRSGAASGTATLVYTFTLSGSYTLRARCTDGTNTATGAEVAVTASDSADTTPPTAPGGLSSTTPASDNTPTFGWTASSDNVGVVGYEVQIDGVLSYMGVGNVLTYTSSALANGTYTFRVRARDAAGNVSVAPEVAFTISASTEPTPTPTPSTGGPPFTLAQMQADANVVAQANLEALLAHLGRSCDTNQPALVSKVDQVAGLNADINIRSAILNFTVCGTPTTIHLGGGERLGVVNSYKSAFGRLPSTSAHWFDVIKIANGRFPGEISVQAETDAKARFQKIYLRAPNMTGNQNDKAAVTVMAYGLRPLPRNLNSEQAAIKIFKGIFNYAPTSAVDWDAVRAIAYSGATR